MTRGRCAFLGLKVAFLVLTVFIATSPGAAETTEDPSETNSTETTDGQDATNSTEATEYPNETNSTETTDGQDATNSTEAAEYPNETNSTETTEDPNETNSTQLTDEPDATNSTDPTVDPNATNSTETTDGQDATNSTETTVDPNATHSTKPTAGPDETKSSEPTAGTEGEDSSTETSPTTNVASTSTSAQSTILQTIPVTTVQTAVPPTACALMSSSCLNGGTFSSAFCECLCPISSSGTTCQDSNPCATNTTLCTSGVGEYCVADITAQARYSCQCRFFDGYTSQNGVCTKRAALTNSIRITTESFFAEYSDLQSAASRSLTEKLKRLLLERLRSNPSTSNVEDVQATKIVSGSVIVTFVAIYPPGNSVPSIQDMLFVLASSSTLGTGSDSFTIDTNAITVDVTSECPLVCSNDGTCQRSGTFPDFTYTCRCIAPFTGATCVQMVSTTDSPTANPIDGLTTLSIALIAVGALVVVLIICVIFVFALMLGVKQRESRYPAKVPMYTRPPAKSHDVSPIYREEATYGDFNQRREAFVKAINRSPYRPTELYGEDRYPYLLEGEYPTVEYSYPSVPRGHRPRAGSQFATPYLVTGRAPRDIVAPKYHSRIHSKRASRRHDGGPYMLKGPSDFQLKDVQRAGTYDPDDHAYGGLTTLDMY